MTSCLTFQQCDIATRWLKTEIDLPRERALDGAVAPQTAIVHKTNLAKRIGIGKSFSASSRILGIFAAT